MEGNNTKKKGKGRPRKIKNENPDQIVEEGICVPNEAKKDILVIDESKKDILIIDESKKDILLKSRSNSIESELEDDNELHKAIIESIKQQNNFEEEDIRSPDEAKKERLVQSNSNSFEHQFDEDDDLHKALIESMKEKNNLEQDFLKESEEEYIFQQLIQQINIEEIENRSLSLPQFTKRLERLCFSESDRAIRDIIIPIIIEYKLNKCNNVELEQCIYDNIYENFIDTLYKKPINLGKTTTAITKDEDELIRKIFLKKE
jgi:hypothetical protein